MKKLTLICTALLTLCILYTGNNNVSAQDKKLMFGVNVGVSMPGGDYSGTDASKQPIVQSPSTDTTHIQGYAKTGFHFEVYGAYMIAGPLGIMLSDGGSMNSYDVTKLDENYAASLSAGGTTTTTVPAFTASGSYFINQILIGPYVALPLGGDKLKFEGKVLVGLTSANYPELSFSESAYGFTATASNQVKSASGFGYNIGIGLEYMIADMIGLHFNVGYAGSSISYPGYTSTFTETGFPSQTHTSTTPMDMSLSMIQITVGASIHL